MRLKLWKMKPIFAFLTSPRSAALRPVVTSRPSMKTRPEVGASRQPMQCKSVDLPEPEGPTSVKNSPRPMLRLMPSMARTSFSPEL